VREAQWQYATSPVRGDGEEVIHDGDRTRVVRVTLTGGAGTVICKEALGPGSVARMRHETSILKRLAGVDGVPALAGAATSAVVLADSGGLSLAEAIRTAPVDLAQVPEFGARLATILADIHRRGVVHRDLNPANIIVSGESLAPAVIDFDLAITLVEDRPRFAHQREIIGTLRYLAPEQTGRTGAPVDHRTDLYALGAVLYELVAGHPPIEADDELQLIHDILVRAPAPLDQKRAGVPPMLGEIVARLLQKEPDRRYQSAEGLARDLEMLRAAPQRRFTLGHWDFPPRLSAPSHLIGRDREIAALRTAFDEALAARSPALLVTGDPGVGKSALLNEVRPMVAAAGGWFVAGRFDQHRPDAAGGAVMRAIRGIGRLLLAEPEAALAMARRRLQRALGANAGLITAALPEFAVLLGEQQEPTEGDPAGAANRLRLALLDLLRAIASPSRPVVMVVDDLQWADPASLELIEALLSGAEPVGFLLVGAFRPGEVGPTHPLAAAVQRWQQQGSARPPLALENLPRTELAALLAEMLRLPADRAAELAELVWAWTAGNPFDTVELINALRRDEVLVLAEAGWKWAPAPIRRYIGRGDVTDLIRDRVMRLAPATREVVEVAACLGAEARLDLLAAAADVRVEELPARLGPALEDGLLVQEENGGGAEDTVRFRHDRVHQAAYAILAPAKRPAMHLCIARRLARLPGAEGEAAQQYIDQIGAVTGEDELRDVARLCRSAAAHARHASNHAAAERFLSAATRTWQRLGAPPDDPVLVELAIERHRALYSLGRLDDADRAYAEIEERHPTPVELTTPACVQVSSLSQRGRHAEAARLCLDLLARLGCPAPEQPELDASNRRGLADLVRWAGRLDLQADLSRPESGEPSVRAAEQLFSRLLPCAFFLGDPALIAWIILHSQRMWVEHGPSAGLAANLSCAGLVAMPALEDYRIGYTVGRHVLAVAEARDFEPETSVLRHRHALHLMHWVEPLENSIDQAQRARDGLLRAGDMQMASHTCLTLLPAQLECGRSLEAYAAEIEAALTLATRTGNHHSAHAATAHRQLARTLTARSAPTGRYGDESFDEQRYLAEPATNPMVAGIHHMCRSLAAAIAGDEPELLRHTAQAYRLRRFVPGYQAALISVLRALALARRPRAAGEPGPDQPGPDQPGPDGSGPDGPGAGAAAADPDAELAACREWLAARAQDAPSNLRHLLLFVDAELAWTAGDLTTALATFDEASREADARVRPWHHAMISERGAYCFLAAGLSKTGHHWLAEARRGYASWGAEWKVAELDRRYPALRRFEPRGDSSRSLTLHRSSRVDADTIDMLTILRASQALSSETKLSRLHAAIVTQLTTLTGATEVLIVLYNSDTGEWFLSAEPGGDPATPLDEAAARGLLPVSAFRYVERTREPLMVEDAVRDERLCRDPYFAGVGRCSLLAVPILNQGLVRAVLLLTNQRSSGAFVASRLDAVNLLAGQLSVSLGNALLYRSMEERVANRTEALAAANRMLEIQSTTDALTGLANRRRFGQALAAQWEYALAKQTSVGIAMIDVDRFKAYNDHYGHLAGDECLRSVAATLQTGTRSTDLVCRYGGEEFAIVLAGVDDTVARMVGERARAAVAALGLAHQPAETGIVTVSVGVATVTPTEATTAEDLIARADAALYEAKRHGRNRVRCAGS
jgi:diguanylate cyclase (GGDEF)-like protein